MHILTTGNTPLHCLCCYPFQMLPTLETYTGCWQLHQPAAADEVTPRDGGWSHSHRGWALVLFMLDPFSCPTDNELLYSWRLGGVLQEPSTCMLHGWIIIPLLRGPRLTSYQVIQPHHLLHSSYDWRDACRKTVAGGKDGALQLSELWVMLHAVGRSSELAQRLPTVPGPQLLGQNQGFGHKWRWEILFATVFWERSHPTCLR